MSSSTIYKIDSYTHIERMFSLCQQLGIDMYKTRITASIVSWVVELPDSALRTRFLLEFGEYVTNITGTYYI